jgi:transcriptional regulator of nitric oxide reductase
LTISSASDDNRILAATVMKTPGVTVALLVGLLGVVAAGGQGPGSTDPKLLEHLKRLFPTATSFSPKGGEPPHFKAYMGQTMIGLAFWTTELEPLERGYDGPISILVGMDMKGLLTGVVVTAHKEPYGDFSVDPPAFAAQFRGKNIRDPFTVGKDIDAVSRATVTITSASRAIRRSSRRVATALLAPPAPSTNR